VDVLIMGIDSVLAEARQKEQAGDLPGALRALETAPEKERTGAWHYARGAMAVREGKLDEAVAELEKAVQREPEVAEYRSNLGAALLEKVKAGDKAASRRALEELELAAQWGATLPDVYANLSFARLAEGNAVGALAAADVGIRLDGKHVPSLFNRAAALNALKQYGTCIDTLEEILKLSPGFPPAVQSKASTLERMRKI
jgi:tetratricopeptide (TPR) repeat protein